MFLNLIRCTFHLLLNSYLTIFLKWGGYLNTVHVVKYLLAAFTSWDDDVYYFVENKIKERKKKYTFELILWAFKINC